MNFTLLLVLFVVSFCGLWLSAKFMGKKGLMIFGVVNFFLAGITSGFGTDILMFSVPVGVEVVFFTMFAFLLFLLYNNYGRMDAVKVLALSVAVNLLYAVVMFFVYVYEGIAFGLCLKFAFFPLIILLFATMVLCAVGTVLANIGNFLEQLNFRIKSFIVILISLLSGTFVFVLLMGAYAGISFGTIILSLLLVFFWEIIFLALLFILTYYCIKINDNYNLEQNLKKTVNKVTGVVKNFTKPKQKDEEDTVEENKNNDNIKKKENEEE